MAFAGKNVREWILLMLVFLSRLPFLNNGFGSEEDSWGIAVVARNMAATGNYEASRLPGHPLQEYVYAAIANQGAFIFNLVTSLFSVVSVWFFMQALKKLHIKNVLPASIAFAFVPVIYIASTNNLDYMWAMAFIMAAFYFLISEKIILAGMLIALAVGCRITSGVFLLPFVFWLYQKNSFNQSISRILKLTITTILFSLLLFVPVIKTYGVNFFDYIVQFPDQPFPKIIYKATFGVWGTLGFIDLCMLMLIFVIGSRLTFIQQPKILPDRFKLVLFCLLAIFSNLIIYYLLPQKSAYLIPMIPFVIMLIAVCFDSTVVLAFSISILLSCFTFGINLNDTNRGSQPSAFSTDFRIAGQVVSVDVLRGPVKADYLKRKNKMEFADEVVAKIKTLRKKAFIIVGFWGNDILFRLPTLPSHVEIVYYTDEEVLKGHKEQGAEIYYLPEQDRFNDECYGKFFTRQYAMPFFP